MSENNVGVSYVTEHTVTFSTKELIKMISLVYPEIFVGNEEAVGKITIPTIDPAGNIHEDNYTFDEDASIELKIKQYPC